MTKPVHVVLPFSSSSLKQSLLSLPISSVHSIKLFNSCSVWQFSILFLLFLLGSCSLFSSFSGGGFHRSYRKRNCWQLIFFIDIYNIVNQYICYYNGLVTEGNSIILYLKEINTHKYMQCNNI